MCYLRNNIYNNIFLYTKYLFVKLCILLGHVTSVSGTVVVVIASRIQHDIICVYGASVMVVRHCWGDEWVVATAGRLLRIRVVRALV